MSTRAERDQLYDQRKDHCPRLVSDGDSWFDYPIHANLVDWLTTRSHYAIRRFEQSGDTLKTIAGAARYRKAVQTEKPRALLISGGGNDLVRDWWLKDLFQDPKTLGDLPAGLNGAEWAQRLEALRQGFLHILESATGVPVIVHGYDYFVPSDAPVRLAGIPLTGPWFFPAMKEAAITQPDQQQAISHKVVDDFNAMLIELARQNPAQLHHIDLRNTLKPKDWANEIHPTARGFKTLADRYWPQLRAIVGG